MANTRKLSNEEAELLADAEKVAKAGFSQKINQTDEKVKETVELKNFDPSKVEADMYQQYAKTIEVPPYQPEEEPEETIPDDPDERLRWTAKMLKKINPKCPITYEILKQWKQMHGSVFVLNIQDKVYLYRYIKRQEWAQLQASESFANMTPIQQEDSIVERCMLWPEMSPIVKASMPAGAPSMLAEQIRIQSMFLDPVQVANITLKL